MLDDCENCNAKERLLQLKSMVDEALKADHQEMACMLSYVLYSIGYDFGDKSLRQIATGVAERKADITQWLSDVAPEGRA